MRKTQRARERERETLTHGSLRKKNSHLWLFPGTLKYPGAPARSLLQNKINDITQNKRHIVHDRGWRTQNLHHKWDVTQTAIHKMKHMIQTY